MSTPTKTNKFLNSETQDTFPAEFETYSTHQDEPHYISEEFTTLMDWPREGGILFDDNILFDHFHQDSRIEEAFLKDEEVVKMMAITGHIPERANVQSDGQYLFKQEYNHEDVEELFRAAYRNEVDMYYVDGVGNEMIDKGAPPHRVSKYMEEIRKIADPVEVEPLFDDGKIDPSIKVEADKKDLNIVTADTDFVYRVTPELSDIRVNAYTVPTMLDIIEKSDQAM